jgi:NADH-quinone oxidoreductase subunit A
MLQSYLPVLVFAGLGAAVGTAFTLLNHKLGPSRPNLVKSQPYECGLPSDIQKTFRFGISFYMVAMLFILFDIEVIFLYPVSILLTTTESLYVLGSILVFLGLLVVALIYEWRRGALNWR